MKIIKLPQLAWYNPRDLDIFFPDNWEIEVNNIAGYNRSALTADQIKASVTNLINMQPIHEAAKGKKEAVIIFDDMARVTRVSKIIPHVLQELREAGISDDHIRFVSALGSHGAMDRIDFVKKLGEEVLGKYPVYNHNAFDNCVLAGTTVYGTKIYLNAEVMLCDFKIAIGTVSPHPAAVFSGGGKIILPGVAHISSIEANHGMEVDVKGSDYETNPKRLEKEEAARLCGLNIAIECIVNMWGETAAIYAGAEPEAHEAAVKDARDHYMVKKAEAKDIVIANTYAKVAEAGAAIKSASVSVKQGGDLVLIANAPAGQVAHYMLGKWGKSYKGRLKSQIPPTPHIKHMIRYNEYPDAVSAGKAIATRSWADTLKLLQQFHGDSASVVVYPNSDIQYFG
ncbi:MAG: lactate racemase domain-containing protein [Chloroflexi bacterium]|nr:lactate racemase domain-containing protein [Chloroflexota bacterium]